MISSRAGLAALLIALLSAVPPADACAAAANAPVAAAAAPTPPTPRLPADPLTRPPVSVSQVGARRQAGGPGRCGAGGVRRERLLASYPLSKHWNPSCRDRDHTAPATTPHARRPWPLVAARRGGSVGASKTWLRAALTQPSIIAPAFRRVLRRPRPARRRPARPARRCGAAGRQVGQAGVCPPPPLPTPPLPPLPPRPSSHPSICRGYLPVADARARTCSSSTRSRACRAPCPRWWARVGVV